MRFPSSPKAAPKAAGAARDKRRRRGFEPAFGLMQETVRAAGETRGFALARLLTQWPEIAGPEIGHACLPVKVGYKARGGFGATLTLLVSGAMAPIIMMQKETLRARVNAVYGYNAIARILITQTSPTGFSEGQAAFEGQSAPPQEPNPAVKARASEVASHIHNQDLRQALETLAQNVFHRNSVKEERR